MGGERLSLSQLRGQVVVLNMWASWCYPCRTEVPALVAVAHATTGRGISFVGLDELDSSSSAKNFLSTDHVEYPNLVDADGSLLARLGLVPANAIPSTLIVDRTGHAAARVIGPVSAAELTSVLAQLAP